MLIALPSVRRYARPVLPPTAHVERFRSDWRALDAPDGPFGIAVSGGPDSLALLLLAAAAFPGQVRAATVDHGLRAAAATEADGVARVCADLGVPHRIIRVTVSGSVQAAARDARYAALADWACGDGLRAVATAHHADDQAETLLMRLARGSGPTGLSAIRAARPLAAGVMLLRPLLGWRKAALGRLVADAGLAPADDPSNRDPRFDRTRARSALEQFAWLDPLRLAASVTHLAEAEDALAWTAAEAARSRIRAGADGVILDPSGLPRELQRRLVAAIVGAPARDGPVLDRLLAALRAGKSGTIGDMRVLPGACWRFVPAPPRRSRRAPE